MNINNEWDPQSIQHYKTVEGIRQQIRKGNAKYLAEHPEIRAIIRFFLHETLNKNPKNIYEFGAKLFNCNITPMMVPLINHHLKHVNEQLRKGRYHEFDGDLLFEERGEENKNASTHSLLSKSSVAANADALLTYAAVLQTPGRSS